jgi:RNA polymerase-binding transcription factor DksA
VPNAGTCRCGYGLRKKAAGLAKKKTAKKKTTKKPARPAKSAKSAGGSSSKKSTKKSTKKTAKKSTKKTAKKAAAARTTKKTVKTVPAKPTKKTVKKVAKKTTKKVTKKTTKKVVKKAPVSKKPAKKPAKKTPSKKTTKKVSVAASGSKKPSAAKPTKKTGSSKAAVSKGSAKGASASSSSKAPDNKAGNDKNAQSAPIKRRRPNKAKKRPLILPDRPLLLGPNGPSLKPIIPSGSKVKKKKSVLDNVTSRRTKTPLTKTQLDHYRMVLLQKRSELLGDMRLLESEASRGDSGSASHSSQHLDEQGAESYEQSLNLNLAASDRELINEIDAALKRITDRTYGLCELTHVPIKKIRLDELPWARYTIQAAQELDRRGGNI